MADVYLPYKWKPRAYQLPMWEFLERNGKRGVAVWHRRAGKDLFSINWCAVAAHQRVGLYWHLLPTYNQGRKIVWNGFTKEGRRFIDAFPKELVAAKNDTDMRITLRNGSIYQVVGTDDSDRLVGTNPVGCVFSEYSLQDPKAWDIIRPILAENGGWALFIYTPRGHNHGHTMFKMAVENKKWHAKVLKAGSGPDATKRDDGTPVISDEVINDERESGMSEALVDQEFYCSFDAPVVGSYYGTEMLKMLSDGRQCPVLVDPKLPVNTAWDLGMDDAMAIVFFQLSHESIRIIDYYENSGEGLEHYFKVLQKRDYYYGEHLAPHDIKVRELGTGKSRLEVARSLGIRFRIVAKQSFEDGVQAVRDALPRTYIDTVRCTRIIDALCQYHKAFNEDTKTFSSGPDHDWTSHPCDAVRIMAQGIRERSPYKKAPQEKAESDYEVM